MLGSTALGAKCGDTVTAVEAESAGTPVGIPTRVLDASAPARVVSVGTLKAIPANRPDSAGGEVEFNVDHAAAIIGDVATIGAARDALRDAGWHATISGNRITANNRVCIQYLGLAVGPAGRTATNWLIYKIACRSTDDNRG